MPRHATPFRILNSLTNQLETLYTRHPHQLTWYICGPTVYDSAHLGHARTYVCFDIMRRIMERYGGALRIRTLMGITDIDDKIIGRAAREGLTCSFLAHLYEAEFMRDLERLHVRLPERFARVSDHIPQIVDFISRLVAKHQAYRSKDGSVYFSLQEYASRGRQYPRFRPAASCSSLPEGHTPTSLMECKQDQRDFVLWRAATRGGEPSWPSPWGEGRPGWHVECSAIGKDKLDAVIRAGLVETMYGERLDLHSGGVDLVFPHHENELAQSEAQLEDGLPWCEAFLHTGHLYISQQKMSKSLRNFITIQELLDRYEADDFRMLCLLTPYKRILEYSEERMLLARRRRLHLLNLIRNTVDWIGSKQGQIADRMSDLHTTLLIQSGQRVDSLGKLLVDDFNWSAVVDGTLVEACKAIESQLYRTEGHPLVGVHLLQEVHTTMGILGLASEGGTEHIHREQTLQGLVEGMVGLRAQVRRLALEQMNAGNHPLGRQLLQLCDQSRSSLSELGIQCLDGKNDDGSWRWNRQPAKVEADASSTAFPLDGPHRHPPETTLPQTSSSSSSASAKSSP